MAKKISKGEALTMAMSDANNAMAGVKAKKTVKKGKENGRKRSK